MIIEPQRQSCKVQKPKNIGACLRIDEDEPHFNPLSLSKPLQYFPTHVLILFFTLFFYTYIHYYIYLYIFCIYCFADFSCNFITSYRIQSRFLKRAELFGDFGKRGRCFCSLSAPQPQVSDNSTTSVRLFILVPFISILNTKVLIFIRKIVFFLLNVNNFVWI